MTIQSLTQAIEWKKKVDTYEQHKQGGKSCFCQICEDVRNVFTLEYIENGLRMRTYNGESR